VNIFFTKFCIGTGIIRECNQLFKFLVIDSEVYILKGVKIRPFPLTLSVTINTYV